MTEVPTSEERLTGPATEVDRTRASTRKKSARKEEAGRTLQNAIMEEVVQEGSRRGEIERRKWLHTN